MSWTFTVGLDRRDIFIGMALVGGVTALCLPQRGAAATPTSPSS